MDKRNLEELALDDCATLRRLRQKAKGTNALLLRPTIEEMAEVQEHLNNLLVHAVFGGNNG